MLRILGRSFSFKVPRDRVELLYSRASGAGGQNIAASNSKVQIRFELAQADWLSASVRAELAKHFGRVVVLACQESRSCKQNENLCFAKLSELITKTEEAVDLSRKTVHYTSFTDWIRSIRTDKQMLRHKTQREASKRRHAQSRRHRLVDSFVD